MGHSIRVHREFYRLPLDLVQRAKVAKILLAANEGLALDNDGKYSKATPIHL